MPPPPPLWFAKQERKRKVRNAPREKRERESTKHTQVRKEEVWAMRRIQHRANEDDTLSFSSRTAASERLSLLLSLLLPCKYTTL